MSAAHISILGYGLMPRYQADASIAMKPSRELPRYALLHIYTLARDDDRQHRRDARHAAPSNVPYRAWSMVAYRRYAAFLRPAIATFSLISIRRVPEASASIPDEYCHSMMSEFLMRSLQTGAASIVSYNTQEISTPQAAVLSRLTSSSSTAFDIDAEPALIHARIVGICQLRRLAVRAFPDD